MKKQIVGVILALLTGPVLHAATVSFGTARVYGEEGAASVSLPVVLSASANATVHVAIAGTALPGGTDFSCSTTLIFSASGSTASNMVFTITDDALAEGPESARLRLGPVSGVTMGSTTQAVLFVRDNDAFSIVSANLTSGTNEVNSTTTWDDPGGRILEALCPDVALMQEWVLKPGITYRGFVDEHFGTGFSYYVEYQTGSYAQPNGIISRWPIVDYGEWPDGEVFNRDFAWVKVDLPGSKDLHAVSVHLKASSLETPEEDAATRLAEARALTNYIAQAGWLTNGYVVVGGDLNLTNRTEWALKTLTNIVSDSHQPADQDGDRDTNSGKYRPYDLILPGPGLDERHCSIVCYGETFPNGMVFDTRPSEVTWSGGVPPPALTTDSAAENMQHLAVMKVFELEKDLEAPSTIWASLTNTTAFTAAWNSVPDAIDYRLDVGTSETFMSAGGGGSNLMTNPGFESGDSTGWTKFETEYAVVTTDPQEGAHHVSIIASATRDLTQNVSITGDGVTEYEISYWYKGTGNARIWAAWTTGGQVSGDSLQPTSYNPATSAWTKISYSVVPQSGANVLFYEIRTYSGASMSFDSFFAGVAGTGGGEPDYVAGYSNRTVLGTSQSVTGLTPNTTYYFRARAVDAVGPGSNSVVASVTTMAEVSGTPPVMDAIPSQNAMVGGEDFEYTVTAAQTDGDPILAFACTSAVDTNTWDFDTATGDFLFIPTTNETGVNLFSFTASDKDGTSPAVAMTVTVSAAASGASDLFISEYIEGESYNKAVEIFNGTGTAIDLSDYEIRAYFNGSTSYSSVSLNSTLANGAVYVITHGSANAAILAVANLTNSTVMNFNGDDALALYKVSSASFADIFGRIGEDPGTAWTDGSHSTVNQTLVRKSSVTGGITVNPAAGFPSLASEWDSYARDTVSGLGSHSFDGGTGGDTPYDIWADGRGMDPEGPLGGADDDYDSDTMKNYDEYLADTDPTDPDSVFEAAGAAGTLHQVMTFPASTNRRYSLLWKSEIGDAAWIPLLEAVQGTNAIMSLTDTNRRMRAYYRLEAELLP